MTAGDEKTAKNEPNDDDIESLRQTWTYLYTRTLPSLARSKHPVQPKWPVTLDHCFARIILDNTVGFDLAIGEAKSVCKWDEVVKRPAVRNLTGRQLRRAIKLGREIRDGEVDLVELDEASLIARGKKLKGKGKKVKAEEKDEKAESESMGSSAKKGTKRKRTAVDQDTGSNLNGTVKAPERSVNRDVVDNFTDHQNTNARSEDEQEAVLEKVYTEHDTQLTGRALAGPPSRAVPMSKARQTTLISWLPPKPNTTSMPKQLHDQPPPQRTAQPDPTLLSKIQHHPSLSPLRRRLYATLLLIPTGHWTTYAQLSTYLHTSPRAIGSMIRNNPFAPEVPCHRVLASDGSIGGFGCGGWGVGGKYAGEKRELLSGEGVRFDSRGVAKGLAFVFDGSDAG